MRFAPNERKRRWIFNGEGKPAGVISPKLSRILLTPAEKKKSVDNAKKHFNEGTSIIFYGYPEDAEKNTKSVERISRTKKHIAGYAMLDESMSATMFQEKFLSNDKNKQRLLNMLCAKFQKEGFVLKQAQEDADYPVIKSALEIGKRSQFVVVIEDIDLLLIMTASTNSENIFFLKPRKG
ncbi:hypothetical protein AVEN_128904-1 [Araneus ventricosus]|uniref:Uncharacterized protein n=1 Tax=Araneus ventricosus TaxID=182803 RepID=A0A4Y2MIN0_ARAVE|nr:hypothetical protein AVEN_128904-1 [Araneus ventricosus]